jgi:photosystem II stability/assembly factor-like uncharacterized protein
MGGGILVATDSDGGVLMSLDGEHWTRQTISAGVYLKSCVYAGSCFFAVSNGGHAFKSADGVTWDDLGVESSLMDVSRLYWDGSRILGLSLGEVVTSTDGENWVSEVTGTYARLNAAVWDGATYVMAGDGGTILASPDAASWATVTGGEWTPLLAITRGAPGFVAGGQGFILASADGTTWALTWNENGNVINDVAYGNGTFVAVADDRTVLRSDDGRSWQAKRAGRGSGWLNGVAFGHGRFVAVGDSGLVYTSHDGRHWTRRRKAIHHKHGLTKVVWSGEKFVAVGFRGVILTSPDGIIWHRRKSGTTTNLLDVSYGPLGFVAVGERTILTSQDGASWTATAVNSNTLGNYRTVAQGGGVAVLAGSGPALVSIDGISWTPASPPSANQIYGLTYDDGAFYAVGDQVSILRSTCQ